MRKALVAILAVVMVCFGFGVAGSLLPEDDTAVDADSDTGDEADETADPEPTDAAAQPSATPAPPPESKTYLVAWVADGDTFDLANGETVRLVGMDSPEVGECGHDKATANLERLVLGKQVVLTKARGENRDMYGRLLRYVDVEGTDAGLHQIEKGLGIARYDSRDGYGFHERENDYISADRAAKNVSCPKPQPLVGQPGKNCAAGYDPCIAPYPPDLNCADVGGPIFVTGNDPHELDADGDGVACES